MADGGEVDEDAAGAGAAGVGVAARFCTADEAGATTRTDCDVEETGDWGAEEAPGLEGSSAGLVPAGAVGVRTDDGTSSTESDLWLELEGPGSHA